MQESSSEESSSKESSSKESSSKNNSDDSGGKGSNTDGSSNDGDNSSNSEEHNKKQKKKKKVATNRIKKQKSIVEYEYRNRVTVEGITRGMCVRLNMRHHILNDHESDQKTYIKSTCLDLIAQAIVNLSKKESNFKDKDYMFVLCHWGDNTSISPLINTNQSFIVNATKDLSCDEAKTFVGRGWFGKKTRNNSPDLFRSADIHLLYNSNADNRENIKIGLERELKLINKKIRDVKVSPNKVWLAKLHYHSKPKLAGEIFYHPPKMNITENVNRVRELILEEKKIDAEITINIEAAFLNKKDGNKFYAKYDRNDEE
eukprot:15366229-Ditylum_brightwellii.AAC.1